jgi:hypothetical protein
MTEDELVSAYTAGQISRRVFIRRLIQGGIGVSAAFAYAEMLASPAMASPQGHGQNNPPGNGRNNDQNNNNQNNDNDRNNDNGPNKNNYNDNEDCGRPDHHGNR